MNHQFLFLEWKSVPEKFDCLKMDNISLAGSDDRHDGINFYRYDNPPDILKDLQNKDRNTKIVISEADEYMIGNRINFLIYVSTRAYL